MMRAPPRQTVPQRLALPLSPSLPEIQTRPESRWMITHVTGIQGQQTLYPAGKPWTHLKCASFVSRPNQYN